MKLLTDNSAKIHKTNNSGSGYYTVIMYLAPAGLSGKQVCAYRSSGCEAACLNTAGMAVAFPSIIEARINKTLRFFNDREGFWVDMISDLNSLRRKAKRLNKLPAARLNGTSDILWESVPVMIDGRRVADNIMEMFPDVVFYDYTKYPITQRLALPSNYSLTRSRSENHTWDDVTTMLDNGHNVAVVLNVDAARGELLPLSYKGYKVIDGDHTDERFLDGFTGAIIGLSMKGKAKTDTTGFVLNVR